MKTVCATVLATGVVAADRYELSNNGWTCKLIRENPQKNFLGMELHGPGIDQWTFPGTLFPKVIEGCWAEFFKGTTKEIDAGFGVKCTAECKGLLGGNYADKCTKKTHLPLSYEVVQHLQPSVVTNLQAMAACMTGPTKRGRALSELEGDVKKVADDVTELVNGTVAELVNGTANQTEGMVADALKTVSENTSGVIEKLSNLFSKDDAAKARALGKVEFKNIFEEVMKCLKLEPTEKNLKELKELFKGEIDLKEHLKEKRDCIADIFKPVEEQMEN